MMVIMIWHGCQIQPRDHFSPLISYPQFSLVAQLCPPLCDPMNCSSPGFPVHYQLPELTQTHIHRVNDAIQPSHPLVVPFSFHLQSFPALGSFPMSQFFRHSSRVEAKNPALLSNRDGYLLELTGWTQGSQAS